MAHKHTISRPMRVSAPLAGPMPGWKRWNNAAGRAQSGVAGSAPAERRDRGSRNGSSACASILTLPVIVAHHCELVWRRSSIAEVQKVWPAKLWMAPLQVSPQAITKRLDVLPAAVMGQLLAQVCARLQRRQPPACRTLWARAGALLVACPWRCSTLEARAKKTRSSRARGLYWGAR